MYLVDTNVLVHAVNADSPAHDAARRVVERARGETVPWALAWSVVYEL